MISNRRLVVNLRTPAFRDYKRWGSQPHHQPAKSSAIGITIAVCHKLLSSTCMEFPMKTVLATIVLFLAATSLSHAAVQGREVTYSANGTTLKGYVAYDDAVKGKRPGILVVHEWWGHNEYARKRARMLAEHGYTALAVDMYGDGKQAHHPDDAQKFSSEVAKNATLAKARFDAALELLKQESTVDANNI